MHYYHRSDAWKSYKRDKAREYYSFHKRAKEREEREKNRPRRKGQ